MSIEDARENFHFRRSVLKEILDNITTDIEIECSRLRLHASCFGSGDYGIDIIIMDVEIFVDYYNHANPPFNTRTIWDLSDPNAIKNAAKNCQDHLDEFSSLIQKGLITEKGNLC